jgi:dihydroxyacetone kinase/dihydroxyacetone kinase-like protein
VPAVDELEARPRDGAEAAAAVAAAATVARDGPEATRLLRARKGRASHAGERSIGSLDAGAVAVATMFERVAAGWS